jgi:hypothetical protein
MAVYVPPDALNEISTGVNVASDSHWVRRVDASKCRTIAPSEAGADRFNEYCCHCFVCAGFRPACGAQLAPWFSLASKKVQVANESGVFEESDELRDAGISSISMWTPRAPHRGT